MPDVLRLTVDDTKVHRLAPPVPVLDPPTAAAVDQVVADARVEAFRDGEAAGRAAARAELDRAVAAVTAALEQTRDELRSGRDAMSRASLDLAHAVATAVLDRTPAPEALEVFESVRRAVALLDDAPLRVHLGVDDARVLEGADVDGHLEIVADATIAPGEARVVGPSSGAELTRSALVTAALEQLGQEAS